ncbi:hypothetical protein JCM10212_006523 [Sporobolomyces blumeae]
MGSVPLVVGTFSKAFLKAGCRNVRVEGLPAFLDQVNQGQGVLTIANHVSVVDEPFMWGSIPLRNFLDSKKLRWTLGASDMMFNGKWDRWFFTKGQVIETFRGKGIYQDAIDVAARKLDQGNWVHIFPEGKIKQEDLTELRRFKWGVSRMLMECERLPTIVPVWIKGESLPSNPSRLWKPFPIDVPLSPRRIASDPTVRTTTGFEQIMDEPRVSPHFVPNVGKDVTILFGAPIEDRVRPLVDAHKARYPRGGWRPSTYDREVGQDLDEEPLEIKETRIRIADELRSGLMDLGRTVPEVERKPPGKIVGW